VQRSLKTQNQRIEGIDENNLVSSLECTLESKNFEYVESDESISVKGRLKTKLPFWSNTLKANKTILDVVEKGYKIPFINLPKTNFSKNNKSAINNEQFVTKSIN